MIQVERINRIDLLGFNKILSFLLVFSPVILGRCFVRTLYKSRTCFLLL